MIVLKILLWLLLIPLFLIALVLLLLCVSLGFRLDTMQDEKLRVTLLIGPFPWRFKSKEKDPKKQAKKKKKADKKAAKKIAKLEKKSKAAKKKPAESKKKKPLRPKSAIFRALLYSWKDYDYPYWKLIKIRKLKLKLSIGGKDSADIGRKYAYVSMAVSNALPHFLRIFSIRRYQLHIAPDFVTRKTSAVYSIVLRIRPIVVLYAALIFMKSFFRNRKIYDNTQSKVFTSTQKKEDLHGKQQKAQNQ